MMLYHATFKGVPIAAEHRTPVRQISALFVDTSIYNIKDRVQSRYNSVSGLCITNCEAVGIDFFELSA